MSCFSGSFASLPGVRCDRFDRISCGVPGDQFFLSHCHTDHMVGFHDMIAFIRRKSLGHRINNKLYCSGISKAFVLNKYRGLISERAIVELQPNEPKDLFVFDSKEMYSLRVTGIGANHCPGSLMFLFEKLDQDGNVCRRILYTGDFRFDANVPLTELKPLHDREKRPLYLDEMYLDTTFCSFQYQNFPTRQEAEEKIWELCQKWIKRNGMFKNTRSKHVVLFHLPARYGYEGILNYVYRRSMMKWRVHVDVRKWSEYICNTELSDCTEPDPMAAQWIHACGRPRKNEEKNQNKPLLKYLPCQPGEFEVCQIKPCAMYFTQSKMECISQAGQDRVVSVSQGGSNYRVCYSCHSSLSELKRFVQHFMPGRITPCAVPPNSSLSEVGNILDSFLQERDKVMVGGDTFAGGQSAPASPSAGLPPGTPTSPSWSTQDCVFSPQQNNNGSGQTLVRTTQDPEDESIAWMNPSPVKKRRVEDEATVLSPSGKSVQFSPSLSVITTSNPQEETGSPSLRESRVSFDDTMAMVVTPVVEEEEDNSDDEAGGHQPSQTHPGSPLSISLAARRGIELVQVTGAPSAFEYTVREGSRKRCSVSSKSSTSSTSSLSRRGDEGKEESYSQHKWGKVEIIPSYVDNTNQAKPIRTFSTQDAQASGSDTGISISIGSKRLMFARSKSQKLHYSMPATQNMSFEDDQTATSKERRFSMPSNMKMPIIKVTPSSPSPDPNHPDYPEFFQDRLYLEHVSMKLRENKSDTNTESDASSSQSPNTEKKIKKPAKNSQSKPRDLSPCEEESENINQLSLRLSGSDLEDGGQQSGESNSEADDFAKLPVASPARAAKDDAMTFSPLGHESQSIDEFLASPKSVCEQQSEPDGETKTSPLNDQHSFKLGAPPKRLKRQWSVMKAAVEDDPHPPSEDEDKREKTSYGPSPVKSSKSDTQIELKVTEDKDTSINPPEVEESIQDASISIQPPPDFGFVRPKAIGEENSQPTAKDCAKEVEADGGSGQKPDQVGPVVNEDGRVDPVADGGSSSSIVIEEDSCVIIDEVKSRKEEDSRIEGRKGQAEDPDSVIVIESSEDLSEQDTPDIDQMELIGEKEGFSHQEMENIRRVKQLQQMLKEPIQID